jgi:hypothetical protein
MLLFTKYGLVSAVCTRQGHGEHGQPVDLDRLGLRFRRRQHLENLQKRFPHLLGNLPVWESASADYRDRLIVPRHVWVQLVTELAADVAYTDFKQAVIDFPGKDEYEQRLLEVWNIMVQSQADEGTL